VPCVTAPTGYASKIQSRFLRDGRERHREPFGRPKAEKVRSLPPNLVFFPVSLFSFSSSFSSSFSRDLCPSQAEEGAEGEAEVGNSYLLQRLRLNSRFAHRKNFLVGLERPTIHFWARNRAQKWGRSSPTRCHPAAIFPIPLCATSSLVGTCKMAKVSARVTDMVICVFHAPFTFPRRRKRASPLASPSPLLLKRLRTREK
jgi:hypothetical protein